MNNGDNEIFQNNGVHPSIGKPVYKHLFITFNTQIEKNIMRNNKLLAFTFILYLGVLAIESRAQEIATWDNWAKGAVTFTFDDGCREIESHKWAVQQLDQYGFKATFNVVANWCGSSWKTYREFAKNGHEIGSQTSSNNALATAELKTSKETIEREIGQSPLTIAYPNCFHMGDSVFDYYIAGRLCNGTCNYKSPSDMSRIDAQLCGTSEYDNDSDDLFKLITDCRSRNGWMAFLIMGFREYASNSRYRVNAAVFAELLKALNLYRDSYWVGTMRDVSMYIRERDNATFKKVSSDENSDIYSLTLDSSLTSDTLAKWDYPLSVCVPTRDNWKNVKVYQNEKEIKSEVIGKYVRFKAVPNGGTILISEFRSPITIVEENGKQHATIDGQYDGNNALEITEQIEVDQVTFQRNFTIEGYSTIVLPFDVYTDKLTGVDSVLSFGGIVPHEGKKAVGMNVVWERDSECVKLQANTPYMLKMNESTLGISGPVTLVPTEAAVTAVDGWELRGTYVYTAWPEDDEDLCRVYGFAGSSNDDVGVGEFVKFGAGSWLRPLRAYLINTNATCDSKVRPAGAAARPVMASIEEELPDHMDVVILGNGAESEEHTTVIGRIDTRTGEFRMLRNYDLKGRNVQGKAKTHAAYYGKKVLNK